MQRSPIYGMAFLVAVTLAFVGCKDPEFAKAAAGMTQATAVIYDLAANNKQQMKSRLTDQASADETIRQLSEEWAGYVRDFGAFEEIRNVESRGADGFTTVVARCKFENGIVIAVIGLDAADKVRNVVFERMAQ